VVQLTQPYCWPQIWLTEIQKWQLPYRRAPRYYLRELEEARTADFIVAESSWGVKTLLDYGIPPGKIVKLSYGVDTELFAPRIESRDMSWDCSFICAGQMSVRKGLHLLLAAWTRLSLPKARLLLVGTPADEAGRKSINNLPSSVEWSPFLRHQDLARVYRQADACVIPSLNESGCMVAYEAAASGLACIVSDRAGSLIRHGIEGLVVKAGSLSELQEAILKVYQDASLRNTLGHAARQRALHFTWKDFARRLVEAYRMMLERKAQQSIGLSRQPIDVFEL
jgi:glycosyltransferase involved in cell wall biosynthesis